MNMKDLEEEINQLRFQLVQIALENNLNFKHPLVIELSQHLDTLIVLYQSKYMQQADNAAFF
jgi:hypothetical protein